MPRGEQIARPAEWGQPCGRSFSFSGQEVAGIATSLLLTLFTAGGCDGGQRFLGVAAGDPVRLNASAASRTEFPFFTEFDDVNPCSGLVHTVTFTGTVIVIEQDGQSVVRIPRTITTSSGFSGRGTFTDVVNGHIEATTLDDMLSNDSGDRIRAHFVAIVDLSNSTLRVFDMVLTCVGPA